MENGNFEQGYLPPTSPSDTNKS